MHWKNIIRNGSKLPGKRYRIVENIEDIHPSVSQFGLVPLDKNFRAGL